MVKKIDLKIIMRRWATGVAIVTTGDDQRHHGMTVSSFTSVSVDPPIVTVALSNDTRTKNLVDEYGYLCINLLAEGQEPLSDLFAGRVGDDADRFKGIAISYGITGVPILEDSAAYVEGRIIQQIPLQHSTLYIAEVLNGEKKVDRAPLIYFNRDYYRISK